MTTSSTAKVKIHNVRQQIQSLRKRRKHLRGRANVLRTELVQVERLLQNVEFELQKAKTVREGLSDFDLKQFL